MDGTISGESSRMLTDVQYRHLSNVLNGNESITANTADAVHKLFQQIESEEPLNITSNGLTKTVSVKELNELALNVEAFIIKRSAWSLYSCIQDFCSAILHLLDSNMREHVSSSTLVWRAIPEQELEKLLTGLDCGMWENVLNMVDRKACDNTYSSAQVGRVLQNIERALMRQNMKDASSHITADIIPVAKTSARIKALISSCRAACCLIDEMRLYRYLPGMYLPGMAGHALYSRMNESELIRLLGLQGNRLDQLKDIVARYPWEIISSRAQETSAEEEVCEAEKLLFVICRCIPENARSSGVKTKIEHIESSINSLRKIQRNRCWRIFEEVEEQVLRKKSCRLSKQSTLEDMQTECSRCLSCLPDTPEEYKYFTRKSREQYMKNFGCSVQDIQEGIIGNQEIYDASCCVGLFLWRLSQEDDPYFKYKDDSDIIEKFTKLEEKIGRVKEWQAQALLESVQETWHGWETKRLFQEKPLSLVEEQAQLEDRRGEITLKDISADKSGSLEHSKVRIKKISKPNKKLNKETSSQDAI